MKLSCLLLLVGVGLVTTVVGNRRLHCSCRYSDLFTSQIEITCGHDSTSMQKPAEQRKPTCSKEKTAYLSRFYEYVPGFGFYRVYRTGTTYEKAIVRCQQDGAILAIPNSKEEMQAVAAILKKNTAIWDAYIGIRDLNKNGKWATIKGDPISSLGYFEWEKGQPSNSRPEGEYCVTMVQGGLYNDQTCFSWSYPFICHRALAKHPPSGYKYIPGMGFYQLYTTPMTYARAKQTCLDDGGHLAVPDTEDENEEIIKLFDQANKIWVAYIGFNALQKKGVFVTETGKLVSSLPHVSWNNGEPNNDRTGEECVELRSNGMMFDIHCHVEHPFFCEIELPKI